MNELEDKLSQAMSAADQPERPKVESVGDEEAARKRSEEEKVRQQAQDAAMREHERLEIEALHHQVWVRTMALKRGYPYAHVVIGAKDYQALEVSRRAMDAIPTQNQ